jgi:hypothetical protein
MYRVDRLPKNVHKILFVDADGDVFHRKNGKIAAHNQGKYLRVAVCGTKYYAHHVVWLLTYGEWPDEIDHIDGNPRNNAITNLRRCTHQQNMYNNRQSPGQSGFRGVWLDKRRSKWHSAITVPGRRSKFLGYFDSTEEAYEAFKDAARELHGEFYWQVLDAPEEPHQFPDLM